MGSPFDVLAALTDDQLNAVAAPTVDAAPSNAAISDARWQDSTQLDPETARMNREAYLDSIRQRIEAAQPPSAENDWGARRVPTYKPQGSNFDYYIPGSDLSGFDLQRGMRGSLDMPSPATSNSSRGPGFLKRFFSGFLYYGGQAGLKAAGLPTDAEMEVMRAQTRSANAAAAVNESAARPVVLVDPATGKPLVDAATGRPRIGTRAEQHSANETFRLWGHEVEISPQMAQQLGHPLLSGMRVSEKVLVDLVRAQDKVGSLDNMIAAVTQAELDAGRDPSANKQIEQLIAIKNAAAKEKPDTATQYKQQYNAIVAKMAQAGELPNNALTDVRVMGAAIDKATSLTAAEKAQAKGYLATNATPAATGTNTIVRVEAGNNNRATSRADKSYDLTSKQLDKLSDPIDQQMARVGRLATTLRQNNPQADALVAPELLTSMAGGQGSGLRMNEAEISRIVGGRTAWENLKSAALRWQTDPSKPFLLTPAQRQQTAALIDEMSKRLAEKQSILDDARSRLLDSNDPSEHRRIYADTRRALSGIDAGAAGVQPSSKGGTQAGSDPFAQFGGRRR
ncbi:MAG: hypothetical protein ACE14M_05120 [Terriglobales bacterium]